VSNVLCREVKMKTGYIAA